MSNQDYRYTLHAVNRSDAGKGASRRLRREGWVPAIVYGAGEAPQSIAVKQDELAKNAKHESFFSQIINLKIEGQDDQEVLVRDVQHHVFKPLFQHFDFQRIVRGQDIHATVALHFIGEDTNPGVKSQNGLLSRLLTSVEIVCQPRFLPEYIEVDLSKLHIGEAVHLSDLQLPEGVRLAGEWSDEELQTTTVAHIVHAHDDSASIEEEAESESESESESTDDEE